MTSRWPVTRSLPDPDPPAINLNGAPPDPATYDGPLNEFIELHGTAVANNTATQTLKDYETLHPTPPPPPPAPAPAVAPLGAPISAGHAIVPDPKKYVTVRGPV